MRGNRTKLQRDKDQMKGGTGVKSVRKIGSSVMKLCMRKTGNGLTGGVLWVIRISIGIILGILDRPRSNWVWRSGWILSRVLTIISLIRLVEREVERDYGRPERYPGGPGLTSTTSTNEKGPEEFQVSWEQSSQTHTRLVHNPSAVSVSTTGGFPTMIHHTSRRVCRQSTRWSSARRIQCTSIKASLAI